MSTEQVLLIKKNGKMSLMEMSYTPQILRLPVKKDSYSPGDIDPTKPEKYLKKLYIRREIYLRCKNEPQPRYITVYMEE